MIDIVNSSLFQNNPKTYSKSINRKFINNEINIYSQNNNENKSYSNNRLYHVQNNFEKVINKKKINKGFEINNIDN